MWLTVSSSYDSIPLTLLLIGKDCGLSTLCHIRGFGCQQRVLKSFPGPGYLRSVDEVFWLWHSLVKLYMWLTIWSSYSSIALILRQIGKGGCLSTPYHSCRFSCQQRVLKMFPGLFYLHPKNVVVWLWHSLLYLYIWLSLSSCYSSILLTLSLIGRDGGLRPPCQSCGFGCQQRVLKAFHGHGYLPSDNRVNWLCHSLVNLYIWLTHSSFCGSIIFTLGLVVRDGGLMAMCDGCAVFYVSRVC